MTRVTEATEKWQIEEIYLGIEIRSNRKNVLNIMSDISFVVVVCFQKFLKNIWVNFTKIEA